MAPDPRRTLQTEWPEVKVFVRYMPERYAMTTWADDGVMIELACDLGPEQQRFSLAHELGHLVVGKPCRSFCPDNEREVVAWTARYLIPDVEVLGELLATMDVAAAAGRMGLPSEAILDRLAHMTPAETDTLAKYLRAEGGQRGRSAASERTTRRRERPVDGRVDRVVERGV